MPAAIVGMETFNVVLPRHKGRDPEPFFTVRPSTLEEFVEATLATQASRTDLTQMLKVAEIVRNHLAAWGNQCSIRTGESVAFDPSKLTEVITTREVFELLNLIQAGACISNDELKKSDSPH